MTTTDTNAPPPLEWILPYVISGFSGAVSIVAILSGFASSLISITTRSIGFFSPLPIILYLLAPLIVFFDIVADIFIRWPHKIAFYLLEAFYPIYVFCGVACIVGVLVGGTGRLVSQVLVDMVTEKEDDREQDTTSEVSVEVEVKPVRREKGSRRGERRWKMEDDE